MNTKDEPGRTSVCSAETTNKGSWRYDKPGDAEGGRNSGVNFTANTFAKNGGASNGNAYNLDGQAVVE